MLRMAILDVLKRILRSYNTETIRVEFVDLSRNRKRKRTWIHSTLDLGSGSSEFARSRKEDFSLSAATVVCNRLSK